MKMLSALFILLTTIGLLSVSAPADASPDTSGGANTFSDIQSRLLATVVVDQEDDECGDANNDGECDSSTITE